MITRASTTDDSLSEFRPEIQDQPPGSIIEIVPATFLASDENPTWSSRHTSPNWSQRVVSVSSGAIDRVMLSTAAMARACREARPRWSTRIRALRTYALLTPLARTTVGAKVTAVRGTLTSAALQLTRSAQMGRVQRTVLRPAVAYFAGGIALGVVAMWALDSAATTTGISTPQNAFAVAVPAESRPAATASAASAGSSSDELTSTLPLRTVSNAVMATGTAGEVPSREQPRRPMTGSAVAANSPTASRRVQTATVPRFRGTLAVDTITQGARVFVNGDFMGVTPLVLKDLPVGSRAVRVEAAGYRPWSSSVQVTANRQTRVAARLERLAADPQDPVSQDLP